ncbi:MAG: hypothetical protein WC889_20450, partial [Myxococcota bacterium]
MDASEKRKQVIRPIVAIFSAVLVVFCVIFYYNYTEFRKIIISHVEEDEKNIAGATANSIQSILTEVEKSLATIIPVVEESLHDPVELNKIIINLLEFNANIYGSSISLEPGVVGPGGKSFGPYHYRSGAGGLIY